MLQNKVKTLQDQISLIQSAHSREMKRTRRRMNAEKSKAVAVACLITRRERVATLTAELDVAKSDLAKTEADFRAAQHDLLDAESMIDAGEDSDAIEAKPSCGSPDAPLPNANNDIPAMAALTPNVSLGIIPPTTSNAPISSCVPIMSNTADVAMPDGGSSENDNSESDRVLMPGAFSPLPKDEGYVSPLKAFKA